MNTQEVRLGVVPLADVLSQYTVEYRTDLEDVVVLLGDDPVAYSSPDQLDTLLERATRRIAEDVRRELEEKVLAVLKLVPYTQGCTCQHHPTHVADDCHEHNENPKHFFGDFAFDCTCP